MIRLILPNLKLHNIFELDGDLARKLGIKVLICDLDNTLGKYENDVPDDATIAWVEELSRHGVRIAVVSNNDRERVEKFCTPLGVDFYWKSGKPGRRTLRLAMEKLGGTKKTTALMGDKITTDIFGARRFGILAIKVPPLGKRRMFE